MYVKSFLIACFLLFIGGNALTAQDFDYIGAAKCKMCHKSQYKTWSTKSHAKAYEVLGSDEAKATAKALKLGDPQKEPQCLKCHTAAGHSPDAVLGKKYSNEDGVTCEACHGPGSVYKKKTIMKDREKAIASGLTIPTEEVCRKCHNDESPNWDAEKYEKKDGTKDGFDLELTSAICDRVNIPVIASGG